MLFRSVFQVQHLLVLASARDRRNAHRDLGGYDPHRPNWARIVPASIGRRSRRKEITAPPLPHCDAKRPQCNQQNHRKKRAAVLAVEQSYRSLSRFSISAGVSTFTCSDAVAANSSGMIRPSRPKQGRNAPAVSALVIDEANILFGISRAKLTFNFADAVSRMRPQSAPTVQFEL